MKKLDIDQSRVHTKGVKLIGKKKKKKYNLERLKSNLGINIDQEVIKAAISKLSPRGNINQRNNTRYVLRCRYYVR